MKVTVTFRHTNPTQALKDYAEEKIDKVEKFLQSPQEAHMVLSVEKFRRIAEVNIIVDGVMLTGKEESNDLYSAIDLVMAKIERQLKRRKDRRRPRKSSESIRTRSRRQKVDLSVTEEDEQAGDGAPRIVPSNVFLPKPMSVEDAALELVNRPENVVVFRNSATMNICVLHKMKNGSLGLVEEPSE